jgi:hypothetical protein
MSQLLRTELFAIGRIHSCQYESGAHEASSRVPAGSFFGQNGTSFDIGTSRVPVKLPVPPGGPRFQMMGPLVTNRFIQQNNWPFGGAIAFILMTATLVLTLAANWVVQGRYRADRG